MLRLETLSSKNILCSFVDLSVLDLYRKLVYCNPTNNDLVLVLVCRNQDKTLIDW